MMSASIKTTGGGVPAAALKQETNGEPVETPNSRTQGCARMAYVADLLRATPGWGTTASHLLLLKLRSSARLYSVLPGGHLLALL
jgi:hypothetical protein